MEAVVFNADLKVGAIKPRRLCETLGMMLVLRFDTRGCLSAQQLYDQINKQRGLDSSPNSPGFLLKPLVI